MFKREPIAPALYFFFCFFRPFPRQIKNYKNRRRFWEIQNKRKWVYMCKIYVHMHLAKRNQRDAIKTKISVESDVKIVSLRKNDPASQQKKPNGRRSKKRGQEVWNIGLVAQTDRSNWIPSAVKRICQLCQIPRVRPQPMERGTNCPYRRNPLWRKTPPKRQRRWKNS